MAVSLSQHTDLTCPECGAPFAAEVWWIVDASERPDLLQRIREGTLHDMPCPNGHTRTVDAPLLLYRPGEDPPLLFSPARNTAEEQDRQQAEGLVGLLRQRLGDAWQDGWLTQGLSVAPRDLLPAAVSDDPQAAMRELVERAQAGVARLRQKDPQAYARLEQEAQKSLESRPLVQTLFSFIQCNTWSESRRIVEEHAELLSDEADALLGQLLDSARQRNDDNALRSFEEHRALLQRCRDAGVEQAFAEKAKPPDIPEDERVFLQALASLPQEQRKELVELMASVQSAEEWEAAINERPELRAALEQALAEAAPST
jgi:hypothetical protein